MEEVESPLPNGRIVEYIVVISNNGMTYNLPCTERYVIVNNLVFVNVYNTNVASINSIGRGPFSDPVEVHIGTGMNYYISYIKHCLLKFRLTQYLV